ncbi:MAG: flagellar basal body L-ring protein FlgH [Rubrivivax sp.]
MARRQHLLPPLAALLLGGCASEPASIVNGPTMARPVAMPSSVERVNNGAIFQPHMSSGSLFSMDRPPRSVGDMLKVEIDESLDASQKVKTDTSRKNSVASKGPGTSSGGLVGKVFNLDASASGSDAFEGNGATENTSRFTGQLAASVINVLPNGHLVVAGERSIALNGGVTTLRFSGIVDPKDIRAGNVVASTHAVNARVELAGRGDVSDVARRSWLQRVLTRTLTVW